jgi:hypothetical protein
MAVARNRGGFQVAIPTAKDHRDCTVVATNRKDRISLQEKVVLNLVRWAFDVGSDIEVAELEQARSICRRLLDDCTPTPV